MADFSDLNLVNTPGDTKSLYTLIANLAEAINRVNDASLQNCSITDKDTDSTTTNTSFEDMNSMSKTVSEDGDYLVEFSATISNSTISTTTTCQVIGNGVAVNASVRPVSTGVVNAKYQVHSMGIVSLLASQTAKVQWKVSAGTGSVHQRQMKVTKIG